MPDNYILLEDKKQEFIISTGAFDYLFLDILPEDELDKEEAEEILEMFRDGFKIDDNWSYVDSTKKYVQLFIIPYQKIDTHCTEYYDLTKYIQMQVTRFGNNKAKIDWLVKDTGNIIYTYETEIKINEFNNEYIVSPKGSMFFLKRFTKV